MATILRGLAVIRHLTQSCSECGDTCAGADPADAAAPPLDAGPHWFLLALGATVLAILVVPAHLYCAAGFANMTSDNSSPFAAYFSPYFLHVNSDPGPRVILPPCQFETPLPCLRQLINTTARGTAEGHAADMKARRAEQMQQWAKDHAEAVQQRKTAPPPHARKDAPARPEPKSILPLA
eukprot:gene6702-1198_t